jgi:hypothetical protein
MATIKPFPNTLTRLPADPIGQSVVKPEHGLVNAIKDEPELAIFGAIGVSALAAGLVVVASYFF